MTGMIKIAKKIFSFLMRHKWWSITATIILIIIGLSIWRQATRTPQYLTDKITKSTIVSQVSESGNIQTEGQYDVNSPMDGVIGQTFVKNGQYVYNDSPLFSVKSFATDQEKAMAWSNYLTSQNNTIASEQAKVSLLSQLEAAKKQLIDAQFNYQNITKAILLGTLNPVTHTKYSHFEAQSAEANWKAAQANYDVVMQKYNTADEQIVAAKAAESAAKLNYESKNSITVRAPIAGTITNFNYFPGDRVGLATISASNPVLVIVRSSNLVFKTQINEIDIASLKLSQDATLTIDAVKDKEFSGKIIKIDRIGTNNQGVISYNVYTSIQKPDSDLRVGMSGNLIVETDKRENVLTVANAAIKPYQDSLAVQVFADNEHKTLKYIAVKTGLKGLERTEIIEGLEEGMEVVITSDVNQFRSAIFGG